jgi:hypothetical protein
MHGTTSRGVADALLRRRAVTADAGERGPPRHEVALGLTALSVCGFRSAGQSVIRLVINGVRSPASAIVSLE